MAYDEALRTVSLSADGSLAVFTGPPGVPGSASPNAGFQYRFTKVNGTNQVGLCTAATDVVAGIMQNKPQVSGQAATIGFSGISRVIAGAAISAGALVAPDSVGRAVTDSTHGKWQALQAAGGAGEVISVFRVL